MLPITRCPRPRHASRGRVCRTRHHAPLPCVAPCGRLRPPVSFSRGTTCAGLWPGVCCAHRHQWCLETRPRSPVAACSAWRSPPARGAPGGRLRPPVSFARGTICACLCLGVCCARRLQWCRMIRFRSPVAARAARPSLRRTLSRVSRPVAACARPSHLLEAPSVHASVWASAVPVDSSGAA